ncbi:MAG: transglutaminase domain-containing protein [Chloroflexi bacterium]|nr:MAG: transglutaminase domain-containing protein [Chloroflexota bacterium]
MQSASPSPRFQLALFPGRVWGRTRASMTGAAAWSAVLVFLLALMIARSTATAAWVGGIDVVTAVALGGAIFMGLLALAPVPWVAGLGSGLIAGPVAAALAAGPALRAAHPLDTVSISLVSTWWGRIGDGSASSDPAFYLYLICLLMWVTGGWLAWCVLRWRRPMLGLVPGAAAFATNLLNYPTDQNGYTLAILVLTLALLLWTNYTTSIANATRARVKLTGDARWDFWESGLVAMAALIVLAIMLPPLSTVDRTTELASSAFSSWAQLQQRLSHPTVVGHGGGGGTTGFSTDVPLSGPLKRTHDVVFTYTFTSASGPRYFRGVNETQTLNGEWRYPNAVHLQARIAKNTIPPYAEDYGKLALTAFNVKMVSAPIGNTDILFYPGALFRTDREAVASEVILPFNPSLTTIDRLSSVAPSVSTGTYNITVEYSTATEADLKTAGTTYPEWITSYAELPANGYRPPDVLQRIHKLALDVTAGAVTPYDKAKAIEAYLRGNYVYTLTPPRTPDGVDPLAYFLFDSKRGYCQFFASAMGDMLRSLGIPTRLVNGFGPGNYDTTTQAWVVRGEDAHTWVEVYFPTYGWITFEPTPDGVYSPITRGDQGQSPCLRDSQCDPSGAGGGTIPGGVNPPGFREPEGPGAGSSGTGPGGGFFRIPDAGTLTKVVGIVLAVLLVLFAAAARYLRPRSVMMVWKRTLVLARLAGAERRAGETPLELGRRLALTFPEASGPVHSLADGFVVSAYAPPDLARGARASVMEAWAALRPLLLRRVSTRLRRTRA